MTYIRTHAGWPLFPISFRAGYWLEYRGTNDSRVGDGHLVDGGVATQTTVIVV